MKIDKVRLKQAVATAEQSKCVKYSVGCIITDKNNRIIGEGVNGTPAGHVNCNELFRKESFCPIDHRQWSEANEIHAEMNALLYTDRSAREGGTLYCTHQPCHNCSKHIAASGIARVVYALPYRRTDGDMCRQLFADVGIEYLQVDV